MTDESNLEQQELVDMADDIATQATILSERLSRVRFPTSFGDGGGMSPIIITDGSLIISSIYDAISGPAAGGPPYTYTIGKKALAVVKHCSGKKKPANGNNWAVTIPLLSGAGPIILQPLNNTTLQITGVPTNNQASANSPLGESVLVTGEAADWANATFNPDTTQAATVKIGQHVSLHFSQDD